MVKKTKKNTDNIASRLSLVIKSGKYTVGYKSSVKSVRSGKCKLILISSNCPPLRKSELEYYAMLAKCNVYLFSGNNIDLGVACGKHFRASVMSITDAGDSDIIKAMTPAE